nr:hypothetical protein [Tanacetum cinerariifolium]
MSPPSGEAIMDFVNELGYTEVIYFVSRMETFLTDKANLGSPTKNGRKDKPYVILYCRFTKLIICHLGRIHNIHQRSASSFYLAEEDFRLGTASEKTNNEDQGQAGSDPGRTLESRPLPEQVVMDEDQTGPNPEKSRGTLAGPDLEPTHDEFMADLYPKIYHKINEAVCESMKEAVHIDLQALLRDRFRELTEADLKEILHRRMFETGTYKCLPEHVALYEALEASMERANRDELLTKKDKSCKRRPPQSSSWKKRDIRNAPSSFLKQQSNPHAEQPVEYIPMPEWLKPILDDERPATPEPAWVIPTSHIPHAVNNWAKALPTTYQALAENSLLEKTKDMRTYMHRYYQQMGKTELTQADCKGQAYEVIKAFYLNFVHLQFQMEECHKMLTDQIDWGNPEGYQVSKGSGQALSISKMKVARYLDFGLELLVPEQMWINEVVRTHMRILSVVSIKAYSRYGYDYLKKITLRIADYQEYTITEKDFKNLYPSDFEDLNLLLLQGHLNHLSGSDKRFEYKHDYTIIELPRAIVFLVSNNERKIMRFNEIYKFSDGTLTNIMEAMDYKVKEYK